MASILGGLLLLMAGAVVWPALIGGSLAAFCPLPPDELALTPGKWRIAETVGWGQGVHSSGRQHLVPSASFSGCTLPQQLYMADSKVFAAADALVTSNSHAEEQPQCDNSGLNRHIC